MKLAIALAVVAFTGLARADDTAAPKAADLYAEGQRLYTSGDYRGAADKFQAAWAAERDPVYLYNAAQALRLGKQCAEAGGFYRQFLAQVANPPNLTEVKAYLVEVDACAKAQAPAPVETDPGRGKRRVGLAVGGIGIVGLAVGVVYTFKIRSLDHDHDALCVIPAGTMTCPWDPMLSDKEADLKRQGSAAERNEAIAYGIGGAALVAGVVFYVLGRDTPTERAVSVVPSPGGATVTARFAF